MVLQLGGERLNPSATVDEKVIKNSALVTCVGHWTAFESEEESPNPSVTGKANHEKALIQDSKQPATYSNRKRTES